MRQLLAALAVFCAAAPAYAQSADASAEDQPDIIVQAPDEEVLRNFVGELSAPAGDRQLARWDESICPGVIGMNAPHAQFMIDRIAARAIELGLRVGESGCRANLLIFMTNDASGMATQIAEHPRLRGRRSGNTRGRQALLEFAQTPRAVRWWHVAQTVTGDGFVIARGAVMANGGLAAPTMRVRDASRMRSNTRQDLSQVLIVIDATRINGVRLDTLSDYVAMAALAQIDPEADVSQLPTILSVFNGAAVNPDAPRELTAWDTAYLEGLYAAERTARSQGRQEADIVRTMQDGAHE